MSTQLKDDKFTEAITQFIIDTGLDMDNVANWYVRGQSTESEKYGAGVYLSVLLREPLTQLQWLDNQWQHYKAGGYVPYEYV